MLPIKKLYIDSKFRTADSKSTSNFGIDLKESLTMPDDALFFVDDVVAQRGDLRDARVPGGDEAPEHVHLLHRDRRLLPRAVA